MLLSSPNLLTVCFLQKSGIPWAFIGSCLKGHFAWGWSHLEHTRTHSYIALLVGNSSYKLHCITRSVLLQPNITNLKDSFQFIFLSFSLIHDSTSYFQVSTILQQHSIELCEPQLDVSIFNMEKNKLAKENMKNRVSSLVYC